MASNASPARSGFRMAVLSDIHGNIRALDAVLSEVEMAQPDRIVFCGDVASGPFTVETVERLMELGERAIFIRGNADRAVVSAFDRGLAFDPQEENPALRIPLWNARQIGKRQRDFLARFEDRVFVEVDGLGRTCFCHGSPRSDEEIITMLTPWDHLEKLFRDYSADAIVCGHTHHQFDRRIGNLRLINPGSIGMPYEGRPGAYWALLAPEVELRRTEYDVEKAVEEALASGFPDPSYRDTLLSPPQAEEVAAFFEKVAVDRGERS